MSRSTVKVNIFGAEFSFRTDDPDYMKNLAAYVEAEIQKVITSERVTSQNKATILAAFNIANELFQLKQEKEDLSRRLDTLLEITKQAQLLDPPQGPSSKTH